MQKKDLELPSLTVGELRRLIETILVADSDLDAFCLDHFRPVHRRFSAGMDRIQKENLLLERYEIENILQKLQEHDGEGFARQLKALSASQVLEAQKPSKAKPRQAGGEEAEKEVSIAALDAMSCRLLAKEVLAQAQSQNNNITQPLELSAGIGLRLRVWLNKTAVQDAGMMRGIRHSVEMLELLEERLAQIQKAQESVIGFAVNFEPERREKAIQSQQHLTNLRQQLIYILSALKAVEESAVSS